MAIANHLMVRAIRYVASSKPRSRINSLECPICGRTWDVRNRGRETGFIVAAADSHAHKCSREKAERDTSAAANKE
jgi:hypothetical protein